MMLSDSSMESENLSPPLFLDSNVIVGHQLSPYHRLSNPSNTVFSGNNQLWWSENVRRECYGDNRYRGVCKTQHNKFVEEIRRITRIIEKDRLTPEFLSTCCYLGENIQHYIEKNGYQKSDLLNWLDKIAASAHLDYNTTKEQIHQRLTLHTRETDYPAVTNRIKSLISEAHIERDDSDIEIWLDAHDLAETRNISDLIFVSDNSTHVTKAAHIICNCTKIAKIHELKDYCTQH